MAALERAYSPGDHGRWSARRRAGLVDEAVRALAEGFPDRVAVVAVGGYGRELLCPASDVDLMVLHAERRPDRAARAAERLFYPLWDAGIPLGHAVRTVRDCVNGARERLDVACSLLDVRLVWGDEQLFGQLNDAIHATVSRDASRFVQRLIADGRERYERHGSCSAMLEPDLKEGSGGLRDIHSLVWAGRGILGARRLGDLEAEGMLRSRERIALEDAEEFLIRLRSALHLATGKRTDRVVMDDQPQLAAWFGFESEPELSPPDALMRALFEHAREVEHVRDAVFERVAGGDGTARLEVGPPRTPEEAMRTFAASARSGRPMSPATLDALETAELGAPPYPWSGGTLNAFVEILAAGEAGARTLEAMDRSDLLSRFLPEWKAVRCRPQRDPYHRWTVDVHLLRTAAEAASILEGPEEGDPLVAAAAAGVTGRPAVLLGAFLHDIGKTGRGGHVATGAAIAERVLHRMPVTGPTADTVLFLVKEHLLISDTATRRDLTDENLVLDVASRVGTVERLAMLTVLTAADARATGPHAWTPWRRALIAELVAKVEHVLARGAMGTDRAVLLEERTATVRELLRGQAEPRVEAYLERMPRTYLLSVPPETAARHFGLVMPPLAATEVRTLSGRGERTGTYDLTVVARDRPGLLAKIAGALTLAGLNILSAQAFTTEDGVAVDVFSVEAAFAGDVDEERWRRMRAELRRALEGRISLDYRVREKRRHYRRGRVEVATSVTVHNDVSDFFTVIEVSAADRIGLLFDLARAFQDLELDVHLAKVATYGGRVVDAFYVRDLFGGKVEDADHVREIERAIEARLAEAGD